METKFQIFRDIFQLSLNEKRGLTIYFGGQTIVGAVVKIIGTAAREMQSRQFSRIIVCIEQIEAVAVS